MSRLPNPQKRAEWRARLRRFARSKLSVAEFCRQEKVSVPSLYHWRKRLAASAPGEPRQASEPATFIPVQVTTVGSLHVTFPNGAKLDLPAGDHELVQVSIASIARAQTKPGEA